MVGVQGWGGGRACVQTWACLPWVNFVKILFLLKGTCMCVVVVVGMTRGATSLRVPFPPQPHFPVFSWLAQ
jgi:hypothetical protein